MSDKCKICGDAGIVPYQKGIKCKEKLCPYWRQHQVNIGGCSKRFQYKRRCKLCVCVHSELQPRAKTMSDKPEKIYAYPGSLIYSLKPANLTVEYIRADLLKSPEFLHENGLVMMPIHMFSTCGVFSCGHNCGGSCELNKTRACVIFKKPTRETP